MKNIKIISILLVACLSTQAQTTDAPASGRGGFIGLVGGISMPMGNWTKTAYHTDQNGAWLANDKANLNSGFAGNGSTFGIEGAYFISRYVGFGGMMSYSVFNISTKGLDSLSTGYRASFDVDQVTTTINGSYSIWSFMPGIYLKYPFTDKFSISGKFLAGFTSSTTPKISVAVEDGGVQDGTFIQQPSTANSFGYMVGLSLSYDILKSFALSLSGNYLSCNPDFMIANTNRVNNAGRLITEYNQPLNFISLNIGIAYKFGK